MDNMNTQCPKCKTIFHVTEEILAVKEGLVRCGDCENVFNATWNMVDDPDQAQAQEQVYPESDPQSQTPPDSNPPRDELEAKPTQHVDAIHDEIIVEEPEESNPAQPYEHAPAPADNHLPDDFFDADEDDDNQVIISGGTQPDVIQIANEMSDDEIHRTLRLDEALDLESSPHEVVPREPVRPAVKPRPEPEPVHSASPKPNVNPRPAPAKPVHHDNERIEPRLNPMEENRDLHVGADDRILPHHRHAPEPRQRFGAARRSNVLLKTPPRPQAPTHQPFAEELPHEPPHWVNLNEQESRGAQLLWATGVLLALVVLLAQVRFTLVDELFRIPSTRPFISLFCDFSGCEPPARTDPGKIHIARTRVDLHPNVPGALTIKVNLINRAGFAQPFPPLQLSMTDRQGRIVGRRTYRPSDYLQGDVDKQKLDPGILTIATLEMAQPNESAVGFETTLAIR